MSIRIFRIRLDSNSFQMLLPCDENIWKTELLHLDCRPKVADWNSPEVYVHNPKLPLGNFLHLCSGGFAMDQKTRGELLEFFEMAGELLPIICQKSPFFLFNALNCVNCLDHEKTEWIIGKKTRAKIRVERYEFVPNRLSGSSLFKIPETAPAEVLTVTGLHDPEDEFKTRVEMQGLTGIKFEEIWSDSRAIASVASDVL